MASVPCHAWADEEGTTVDLVQVMCPRKLKVTNNTECWVVCVLNGKVIREWGFDPVSVAGKRSTQAAGTILTLAMGV